MQFFWHFLIDLGGFFWHFLTILVILHFFLSARPEQLVSGAGGAAGGDAGGSGPHKSQVFLHFRFFLSGYLSHFFLLHVSPSLSEHEGEGGGGDGGGAGQKLHVPLHFSKNVLVNEHLAILSETVVNSASQKDGSMSPHGGDGDGEGGGGGGGGGGDGGGAGQKPHVPLHFSKNVLVNEHLAILSETVVNSASQKDGSMSPHGGDGDGEGGGTMHLLQLNSQVYDQGCTLHLTIFSSRVPTPPAGPGSVLAQNAGSMSLQGEGGGGDGGGGGSGGAGQRLHVPLHFSTNVLVNEHLAILSKTVGNSASQKDGSVSPAHGGDGEGGAGGGGAVLSAPTLLMSTQEATRYLRRRVPLNLGSAIFVWLERLLA